MTGERLKSLRKERGWTQKDLQEKTGIAQRNVSSYESGKLKPSSRTLRRFSEAYSISVDELIGDSPTDPALALADPELLQMFRDISKLPEVELNRLKWVISLAIKQNRIQEMMAR